MKIRHLFLVAIMALTTVATAVAQAPLSFTYQAVVRNSSGRLVSNATVGVKISIVRDSATGQVVYNGVLKLTCTSNNPYTVTITNTSTDDSREYVLQGKETRSFTVSCDVTYSIYYSQNSGYLFYPTTGTRTQYVGCGSTYSISFPN